MSNSKTIKIMDINKVKIVKNHRGPIYIDRAYESCKLIKNKKEYIAFCEDAKKEDEETPNFVYLGKKKMITKCISITYIVDAIRCESFDYIEDSEDVIVNGTQELKEALTIFHKANKKNFVYEVDTERVISVKDWMGK